MKKYLSVAFLLSFFAFTGCKKTPVASFTTDKDNYVTGELVKVTNTSKNAYSYGWLITMGNTQTTAVGENPQIALSEPGTHTITLTTYSHNHKVNDRYSQTINVSTTTGDVIFYTDNLDNTSSVYIYLGGNYEGAITQNTYPAPDCGANGCFTTSLLQGTYQFTAILQPYGLSQNISVTVSANTCNKVYINF